MDLMIDLETLGTETEAPIISIGACFFDKDGIQSTFYRTLDVEEQLSSRTRFADGSTIKWWMQQSDAAKKVFKEDAIPTRKGLADMLLWMAAFCNEKVIKAKDVVAWGNGSNFDITLIESLMKDYDVKVPWTFRGINDLRTFKRFVYDGKQTKREGTYHNALDDAIHQANIVIHGMNLK